MDFSSDSPHHVQLSAQAPSPRLWMAHAANYTAPLHRRGHLRVLDDFELVLQLTGNAWIFSQPHNGSVDVSAGQVAFIPPGLPHAWVGGPGRHLALHFDLQDRGGPDDGEHVRGLGASVQRQPIDLVPRFALQWRGDHDALVVPLVCQVRDPDAWEEKLGRLIDLYEQRRHNSMAARLVVLETISWALQDLTQGSYGTGSGPSLAGDPRILDLLHTLNRTAMTRPTRPSVADLAQKTGMGLTNFRAAFQQVTGVSPRHYIERQGIERAARMLSETDMPIHAVAQHHGYDDPFHFSRAFKRVTGQSPRTFRRRAQGHDDVTARD